MGTSDLNPLSTALAEALRELDRRKFLSLKEFIKAAWPLVEPGTEFIDGWHIDAICLHLEAAARREITELIINMPPRHAKSLLVGVFFFCWRWTTHPHERFLYSSYSGGLSIRDSLKCRRVITSEWYQNLWGETVVLTGDQNAKTRFENSQTGMRLATSVKGLGTGEGGDFIVVDDPIGANDANSEVMRIGANDWWDGTMSTRGNNKDTVRIVVMQRLHEADLTGHWLSQSPDIVHLVLPAEYEGNNNPNKLKWADPRTETGELLWPERFDTKQLAKLKQALGSYGTAGQLQQRPSPAGGGILKVDRFQLWPSAKQLPDFTYVLQSYDTAFTESTQNDPTACTVWGIFELRGLRCALLLDAWADHLEFPELRAKVISDWKAVYGGVAKDELHPARRADAVLIEEKGSGQSLIQDLRSARIPVRTYNPGKSDKVSRAHQVTPILELDCLYVLESRKEPGEPITWARAFLKQVERFPNDEHDDLVDTFTQAMIYLRDSGMFDLEEAADELPETRDYHAEKRKPNPYS